MSCNFKYNIGQQVAVFTNGKRDYYGTIVSRSRWDEPQLINAERLYTIDCGARLHTVGEERINLPCIKLERLCLSPEGRATLRCYLEKQRSQLRETKKEMLQLRKEVKLAETLLNEM